MGNLVKFIEMAIPSLFLINYERFQDDRGAFVKTFHRDSFKIEGLNSNFVENYYSVSHIDVIRGMHFQVPPFEHEKLVYVPKGRILDVVLDIRKGSPAYGEFITKELSSENGQALYIPKGCAHGFLSLEGDTNVTYLQTSMYSNMHDVGICYDSFGFDWNQVAGVLSDRDKSFVRFNDFSSPFTFKD